MTETARHRTHLHVPSRFRLLLAVWVVLAVGISPSGETGLAAEWTVPPGINVASQESALRERVTRAARGMLGEHVVDVVVHIGYFRASRPDQPAQPDRIKLPGFNNYIVPSTGESAAIVSEFSRVRQAFVMISDQAPVQIDSAARDLAAQTGMDPSQGDTLRVIPVSTGPREPDRLPSVPGMELAPPSPEETQVAPKPKPVRPMTPEELKEPKSTAHLIQARRRYFAGDFQGSLDEILQAITIDPNNAQAFAMLGSLYYAMNWRGLAVKYWQRSLEIDPTNREVEDLVTRVRITTP